MIYCANQLTGFYVRETLALNGLMEFVVIQTVRSVLLSQISTYLQEHLKLIDGLEASRSEALGQADKLMKAAETSKC